MKVQFTNIAWDGGRREETICRTESGWRFDIDWDDATTTSGSGFRTANHARDRMQRIIQALESEANK